MKKISNILLKTMFTFVTIFISFFAVAQQQAPTDIMRSSGKIYVVITVVLVILFGLFYYVFTLDKKIKKLEERN
jgi:preprotein translocase subunit SecY